ncbi:hypothetical protein C2S52_007919 [Perilla frutescens var. hirtella]|nr:hypothetical protein C2S52_007919 [Perilla frutescens var. hirtella]
MTKYVYLGMAYWWSDVILRPKVSSSTYYQHHYTNITNCEPVTPDMPRVLYDSASRGDEKALLQLLENDKFLLERVSYTTPNNTPLHVATIKGHLPFVKEILSLNPGLAEELNSQQSSPLHIAAARGHVEIAKILLEAAPDMCLSLDCQGRNPLHLAAIKGRPGVLKELVPRAPLAAREKADGGLTLLHLCVKHGRLEALRVLVQELDKMINERNDDGDTILHMAIEGEKNEIMDYLFKIPSINVYAKNSKGQTAKAMYKQTHPSTITNACHGLTKSRTKHSDSQPVQWLTQKRDSIMVVAVLIATMAFQAGVTPPGGVWQEDKIIEDMGVNRTVRVGEAVMDYHHPNFFKNFMRCNAVAFVSSLTTILLLISGLPFRRPMFMWMLMVIMWLTITSVAVTYAISIVVVTPDKDSLIGVITLSILVWFGVLAILLVGNTIRLFDKWLKNIGVNVWRPRRVKNVVEVNRENGGEETV